MARVGAAPYREHMDCCSRRQVITAAAVGVTAPLLVLDDAEAAGRALIATSRVPVGGGVVLAGRNVVVTQPRRGRFKVFSATCTHQGCTVDQVAARTIDCPCHGSKYSISTGAPVAGPAPRALPARSFRISRGKIYLT